MVTASFSPVFSYLATLTVPIGHLVRGWEDYVSIS